MERKTFRLKEIALDKEKRLQCRFWRRFVQYRLRVITPVVIKSQKNRILFSELVFLRMLHAIWRYSKGSRYIVSSSFNLIKVEFILLGEMCHILFHSILIYGCDVNLCSIGTDSAQYQILTYICNFILVWRLRVSSHETCYRRSQNDC